MAYSFMAAAVGRLHGWDDPRVATYLSNVYALQNPDGGYGLNFAYDWQGDGTVNPASTTYTITIAGHVGPVLLEGYKAGVVPPEKLTPLVSLLMTTPKIPYNQAYGKCIAYSRNANDVKAAYCAHNVNAVAGKFLLDLKDAGFDAGGLAKLVADITRLETYAYIPSTMWWRYVDTTSMNDTDHNSAEVEALYGLNFAIAREAAGNHMTNALADNSASPIAHMRLTSLPGGEPTTMSGDTTVWCVLGDQWLTEFDTFVSTATQHSRWAQAAYYASANALAC